MTWITIPPAVAVISSAGTHRRFPTRRAKEDARQLGVTCNFLAPL